jgi:hypothetical protein
MSLSSSQKRAYLKLAIASIYLACMFALYGSERDVIWWFWIWPLVIAVFLYKLILWFGRCPSCREEFSLKPVGKGAFLTTFICQRCGAQHERINTGGGPGGGGP